jgi:hypothetical protein
MHAVTIRRMIVFGVCALGVGALYLVPGVARSPEQIRQAGANEEPTKSAVGGQPGRPEQSASATGDRDSVPGETAPQETIGGPATTASGPQPSATRDKDRPEEDADDRFSPNASTDVSKDSKDSEPPQAVADIEPSRVTPKQLTISWPAADDNVGVVGYRIWLNGFEVATTAKTKARLRWFNNDRGEHVVQIRAVDAAGNQSRSSPTLVITRPSPEPTDTPSPEPSDPPTLSDRSPRPDSSTSQSSESPSGTPTDQKSAAEDERR